MGLLWRQSGHHRTMSDALARGEFRRYSKGPRRLGTGDFHEVATMIHSNVGMHEMALVCGLLSQMAKDFAEGTDEDEGAKADRANMSASFIETARYIVAMLAGHLGGQDQALAVIQQVMEAFGEGSLSCESELDEECEG